MENKHIEGISELFLIFIYGFCNGVLLSFNGPIGIVGNFIWTLIEVIIYLYISKIDPDRTNKAEIAARIGISPSDPRLLRVISELKAYAWPHITSVAVLNKLLKRSWMLTQENPYNVELDNRIHK